MSVVDHNTTRDEDADFNALLELLATENSLEIVDGNGEKASISPKMAEAFRRAALKLRGAPQRSKALDEMIRIGEKYDMYEATLTLIQP